MSKEEKHIVKKFTGFLQPNCNNNELGRLNENKGARGKHRLITNSTVTRSYLTSTVDWQGKIAGLNNKSSKIDDGVGYLPYNTAVHNQVIQEENENNSQHEECKSKGNTKHKNLHTIHQHQLSLPSKESESISGGHNRREEILNADRMERSRTMSSKNSFYCCSKVQSGESSNCIIF